MTKASKEKRTVLIPNPKARLFDQIREVMRFHHYAYRTEKTYTQWVRRYLAFHRTPDRSQPSSFTGSGAITPVSRLMKLP